MKTVRQIGLMIADRQAGPFALAVRSMAAESAYDLHIRTLMP